MKNILIFLCAVGTFASFAQTNSALDTDDQLIENYWKNPVEWKADRKTNEVYVYWARNGKNITNEKTGCKINIKRILKIGEVLQRDQHGHTKDLPIRITETCKNEKTNLGVVSMQDFKDDFDMEDFSLDRPNDFFAGSKYFLGERAYPGQLPEGLVPLAPVGLAYDIAVSPIKGVVAIFKKNENFTARKAIYWALDETYSDVILSLKDKHYQWVLEKCSHLRRIRD